MDGDRILASYLVETPYPVEHAVEVVAGEQSSGTFTRVPGETEELQERFRARVERIHELETVETPSLSGVQPDDLEQPVRYHRAEATVSWSLENMGTNLPTLLSTVLGNLSELRELSGLRLLDIEVPPALADAHPGPKFGIEGTRELVKVYDGPIIGTIIKPSIGLSPQQTAELVRDLAEAGIDFIKDDELMANPPHSPLRRAGGGRDAGLQRHADRTGSMSCTPSTSRASIDADAAASRRGAAARAEPA